MSSFTQVSKADCRRVDGGVIGVIGTINLITGLYDWYGRVKDEFWKRVLPSPPPWWPG